MSEGKGNPFSRPLSRHFHLHIISQIKNSTSEGHARGLVYQKKKKKKKKKPKQKTKGKQKKPLLMPTVLPINESSHPTPKRHQCIAQQTLLHYRLEEPVQARRVPNHYPHLDSPQIIGPHSLSLFYHQHFLSVGAHPGFSCSFPL